MQVMNDDYI